MDFPKVFDQGNYNIRLEPSIFCQDEPMELEEGEHAEINQFPEEPNGGMNLLNVSEPLEEAACADRKSVFHEDEPIELEEGEHAEINEFPEEPNGLNILDVSEPMEKAACADRKSFIQFIQDESTSSMEPLPSDYNQQISDGQYVMYPLLSGMDSWPSNMVFSPQIDHPGGSSVEKKRNFVQFSGDGPGLPPSYKKRKVIPPHEETTNSSSYSTQPRAFQTDGPGLPPSYKKRKVIPPHEETTNSSSYSTQPRAFQTDAVHTRKENWTTE